MKTLRLWSIVMCVLVLLLVLRDIYGFFYGKYSMGTYSILPFDARPFLRGVFSGTDCYVMYPIIDVRQCYKTEHCVFIKDNVRRVPTLDSLQISSVVQYAWKKDSLLMEVILANKSVKWLLASPAISTDANYICQLQEIEVPTKEQLSSCHQIRLLDRYLPPVHWPQSWTGVFQKTNFFEWWIPVEGLLLFMTTPFLNLICLVLFIEHRSEWRAEPSVLKRSLYILALLFPLIVYLVGIQHLPDKRLFRDNHVGALYRPQARRKTCQQLKRPAYMGRLFLSLIPNH